MPSIRGTTTPSTPATGNRGGCAVPGASKNDPVAAKTAVAYMEKGSGRSLNPADGNQFIGNRITGRGIHATFARSGVIKDNAWSPRSPAAPARASG